jgi:hypothetical protein
MQQSHRGRTSIKGPDRCVMVTADHEEGTATTEYPGAGLWHGKHSAYHAASL